MNQIGELRPLTRNDADLQRTATLTNMNWTGEQRFTYQDIDQAPDIRHYYELETGRGDFGFVAEREGRVVGVVWVLFLAPPDQGYGFVAPGVPELSITVWSGYRGKGIGRKLIGRALQEGATLGLSRISLSVEEDNPSLFLYRKNGFERAEGTPEGTYVVALDRTAGSGE